MSRDPLMSFRLADEQAAELEALAGRLEVSKSELLRDMAGRVLAEADSPGVADAAECLRLLSLQARKGNVRAMELLLLRPWERKLSGRPEGKPASEFDALDDELSLRREAV